MSHPLSSSFEEWRCVHVYSAVISVSAKKKCILHDVSSVQPTFPLSNERLSSFTQSRSGHLVARTTDRRAETETYFPSSTSVRFSVRRCIAKDLFHPTLVHDICPKYCMLYAWRGSSATFIAAAVECGVWRGE